MTAVECERPPFVPVIVSVYPPRDTCFLVSIANVEEPEFTIDEGVNFAVASFGTPRTENVVVPENPGPPVTVTKYVAMPLRVMVADGGVAAIAKSPVMTSVTFTLRARMPEVPEIVS